MMLTSRKPRPLDKKTHFRNPRLVIIAAEGKKTEKQYFQLFQDSRIQVKVLATGEDNLSAPEYVLERLQQFRDEYELAADDELWLMLDVDRWGSKKLKAIAQESKQAGFGLAISNPCFEVWLLCHLQIPPNNMEKCCDVATVLRQASGGSYNKSNLDCAFYADKIHQALQTAKNHDPDPQARWPNDVGTHVYRLVNRLGTEIK
ncbi:RloB family protein [Candidatus Venteria ishoeyi]|uniref:RloB-like protein n=1 Tax=Candidatus Venteria ishoeyi TaxID=1899563 RepID=A0A1H6FF24_9GAMM|nr:RloB family protein [Candidatus Venteria ishoeyi]SEH08670.1 Uncharacterised protein [Candidatus Venteria ishoeyi]